MSVKQLIRKSIHRGLKAFYREYFGNGIIKKYHVDKKKIQIQLPNSVYPRNVHVEEFVRIQDHVRLIASIEGKLVVKKYSSIGAGTVIIPGNHVPTVGLPQYLSYLGINDKNNVLVVEEDCWVGAECILLSKCRIGRGAVIGAGSIVTKSIPPYAVATGSPAKIVAVRFSIEQILKHEQILYPPAERFSQEDLEKLFEAYYSNLKVIGIDKLENQDEVCLKNEKKRLGMIDFSKI